MANRGTFLSPGCLSQSLLFLRAAQQGAAVWSDPKEQKRKQRDALSRCLPSRTPGVWAVAAKKMCGFLAGSWVRGIGACRQTAGAVRTPSLAVKREKSTCQQRVVEYSSTPAPGCWGKRAWQWESTLGDLRDEARQFVPVCL